MRLIGWLVTAASIAMAAPCAAEVTLSTIDSAGVVGGAPSMTIGGDGLALISYHDATNGTLKVAHCDDLGCTSATLTTLDTGGQSSAIGTRGDGLGIVAYRRDGDGAVKVAHCNDAACTSASITTLGTGFAPGLTVGVDGLAVVAWTSGPPPPMLTVVHCSDAACSTSTSVVVGLPNGFPSALEATTNALGRPLFGFGSGPQLFESLSVAHCDDVPCTSVSVLTPVSGGGFTSYFKGHGFGLGSDGKPLLSYSGYGASRSRRTSRARSAARTTCAPWAPARFPPTSRRASPWTRTAGRCSPSPRRSSPARCAWPSAWIPAARPWARRRSWTSRSTPGRRSGSDRMGCR